MRFPYPLLLFVGLAACVPQGRPVAPPPPTRPIVPVVRPTPVPIGDDWRDWPPTPGLWRYRRDARGSIALFGDAGQDADLTLRCDLAAGRLYLSRRGTAPGPITIRTTSLTRVIAAMPTGGQPPYVAVALAESDPLLDAIGFSRGHFVVEQAGAPTLVVPAWAEIERVTQDCRG